MNQSDKMNSKDDLRRLNVHFYTFDRKIDDDRSSYMGELGNGPVTEEQFLVVSENSARKRIEQLKEQIVSTWRDIYESDQDEWGELPVKRVILRNSEGSLIPDKLTTSMAFEDREHIKVEAYFDVTSDASNFHARKQLISANKATYSEFGVNPVENLSNKPLICRTLSHDLQSSAVKNPIYQHLLSRQGYSAASSSNFRDSCPLNVCVDSRSVDDLQIKMTSFNAPSKSLSPSPPQKPKSAKKSNKKHTLPDPSSGVEISPVDTVHCRQQPTESELSNTYPISQPKLQKPLATDAKIVKKHVAKRKKLIPVQGDVANVHLNLSPPPNIEDRIETVTERIADVQNAEKLTTIVKDSNDPSPSAQKSRKRKRKEASELVKGNTRASPDGTEGHHENDISDYCSPHPIQAQEHPIASVNTEEIHSPKQSTNVVATEPITSSLCPELNKASSPSVTTKKSTGKSGATSNASKKKTQAASQKSINGSNNTETSVVTSPVATSSPTQNSGLYLHKSGSFGVTIPENISASQNTTPPVAKPPPFMSLRQLADSVPPTILPIKAVPPSIPQGGSTLLNEDSNEDSASTLTSDSDTSASSCAEMQNVHVGSIRLAKRYDSTKKKKSAFASLASDMPVA